MKHVSKLSPKQREKRIGLRIPCSLLPHMEAEGKVRNRESFQRKAGESAKGGRKHQALPEHAFSAPFCRQVVSTSRALVFTKALKHLELQGVGKLSVHV